jgi:transposase
MDVCILNQDGEIVRHRHMNTSPETLLRNIAPDRADMVVAVECLFTGSWLADLCAQEGMPFVLGPALDMQAIHGGKANNDTSDAHKIAGLLRGGMLPQAAVYPAAMRATRDLRRRRRPLMRKRAALLTPIQQTTRQDHLPEIGQKIAYTAHRVGVADRFADPAGHKSLAVDLALIGHDDSRLRDMEVSVLTTATAHHTTTRSLLRTVPGIGALLRLVLLDAIHDLHRCPRVPDVVSYGRVVKWAKESAGKRSGTGGSKSGNADLKWACSEAAVLLLRDHPRGQKYLTRLEKTHGQGKALTILAHHLARAVDCLLKRHTAFEMHKFLHGEGRWSGCA